MVVVSAIFGYLISAPELDFRRLSALIIGGFFLTISSAAMNQVLERDVDALMKRTASRPIPSGKLSLSKGFILALVLATLGLFILKYYVNFYCFILGLSAFISYCFIYTPLKRITVFSVLVGAFPGAIPPMLGWVAGVESFSFAAGILFAIQFIWQFPHFWSIAWKLDEDYKKAGLKMLPFGKKNKTTASLILITSLCLTVLTFFLRINNFCSYPAIIVISALTLPVNYFAFKLLTTQNDKFALKIMLSAYLYLLGSLSVFLVDKLYRF